MRRVKGEKREGESCWKSGEGTNASLYLAEGRAGR